ncbi:hypothetical protein C3B51_06810 [Pseudoalteromonas rubra]|uniref:EF-hand domain-containing protein n=1 Tax=Pseudoalteromonas rubra TaxID=43658 RepID=A0A4Q7EJF5_9GAMM|nr:hypothetical protein [Pseudoalteromonas rubra]RZM83327.1 hypothetical protein C3B51_06810 [Pseudoalteromonas rubra]
MRPLKFTLLSAAITTLLACSSEPSGSADSSNTASSQDPMFCPANINWVTNPNSPPSEIPGGGQNLCQFYQFSWQWFISLLNAPDGKERTFLNEDRYAIYIGGGQDSCAPNTLQSKLFVRGPKDPHTTKEDFTAPHEMNQALNNAVLYDQNGNIVLYETRFDRGMCDVAQGSATLPAGTTEIKTSWRKISEKDKPNYVWVRSDTNNNGELDADEVYGMVGFHLVISTPSHPEFIWATFEHKYNAPDCQKSNQPVSDWSFASEQCTASLPYPATGCNFNQTLDPDSKGDSPLEGPPTEVCQVYAQGTAEGDNQAEHNRANIISLNEQLNKVFKRMPTYNSLRVLAKYELVGGLWLNDVALPSSNRDNQRGSIQLANTTMETNAQQGRKFKEVTYTGPENLTPATNCFDCHAYSGPTENAGVSHIFNYIHGSSK